MSGSLTLGPWADWNQGDGGSQWERPSAKPISAQADLGSGASGSGASGSEVAAAPDHGDDEDEDEDEEWDEDEDEEVDEERRASIFAAEAIGASLEGVLAAALSRVRMADHHVSLGPPPDMLPPAPPQL